VLSAHIDLPAAILGSKNPFGRKACPSDNVVWLLDNTAYRPAPDGAWEAEFVAAYFHRGRKEINRYISNVADLIGLDGKVGADDEVKKRMEERLRPLVEAVSLPVLPFSQPEAICALKFGRSWR
jgi:hypothetical protein